MHILHIYYTLITQTAELHVGICPFIYLSPSIHLSRYLYGHMQVHFVLLLHTPTHRSALRQFLLKPFDQRVFHTWMMLSVVNLVQQRRRTGSMRHDAQRAESKVSLGANDAAYKRKKCKKGKLRRTSQPRHVGKNKV